MNHNKNMTVKNSPQVTRGEHKIQTTVPVFAKMNRIPRHIQLNLFSLPY